MEWHKNGTVTIVSLIFVCSIGAPKGPLKGPFITRRSEVQILPPQPFAGVSQLARESGSYPECHWFESDRRYQSKPLKTKCFQRLSFLQTALSFRCTLHRSSADLTEPWLCVKCRGEKRKITKFSCGNERSSGIQRKSF